MAMASHVGVCNTPREVNRTHPRRCEGVLAYEVYLENLVHAAWLEAVLQFETQILIRLSPLFSGVN